MLLAIAGSALAAASFTDPTGDAGAGPDVGAVAVTNDAAGSITFKLTLANRPTLDADDTVVLVLDSDRNAATGSEGADYAAVVGMTGSTLLKWDGANFAEFGHGPFTAGVSGGQATVTVSKADLGNTTSLDFGAVTLDSDADDSALDVAPDDGWWTYTLTAPEPEAAELESVSARFATMPARAGRVFAVTRVTGHLSNGKTVRISSYRCAAKVAGRALRPGAKCSWRLPSTSKGKRSPCATPARPTRWSRTRSPSDTTTRDPWGAGSAGAPLSLRGWRRQRQLELLLARPPASWERDGPRDAGDEVVAVGLVRVAHVVLARVAGALGAL
jgi:hypothetical protein